MKHLIQSAEKRVEKFLSDQVKDSNRPEFGGMKSEIFEVKPTVYAMTEAVAVYLNKQSYFYQDKHLYEAMNNALDFIAYCQREDGSFDYPSCNFKSAADTSFCFKRLIAAYRMLLKYSHQQADELLKHKYKTILIRSLPVLIHGGFHTPNHRWGITAALMQGINLVKGEPVAQELLKRANQYLQEGIDGNEEGEYAERSTGNYNAVVNNAMMALYEETGDKKYLGYVERNLKMMMYYFDSDDTIFTQNSTRQDQGKEDYPDKYFYQYLYMATKSKEPLFDAAAHKIIKDNMQRGDMAPECLHIIMLHEEMENYEFKGYGFLETYAKYFEQAGVIRVKNKSFGYTLIQGKSTFAFLKFNDTLIYLKIGESYCDIRNFIAQKLEQEGRNYTLTSIAKGWYYLPFEEKQDTEDWWKMDHSKRKILDSSELRIVVDIKEVEKGLQFTVKAQGIDRVPLRVEICIPAGSILDSDHFYLTAEKGSGMVLREGYVTIHHSNQNIKIGPGYGTHEFSGHYSGEDKNDSGYTIYLNAYTPYVKQFVIVTE